MRETNRLVGFDISDRYIFACCPVLFGEFINVIFVVLKNTKMSMYHVGLVPFPKGFGYTVE